METITRRTALRALAVSAGIVGAASISPAALAQYGGKDVSHHEPEEDCPDPGKLTGRLVFPEDGEYDEARQIWNRNFNSFPLVIVFCQNAQDVINAIVWSRQHDIAFRARAGRHALEGWSTVDGGVIIDVSELKEITVDVDARRATVQTGITQDVLVSALGEYGFTVPTGSEILVGVAGVTLGGGIGQLNRSLGVTSDSLVGLDIVVPHGEKGARLIHANEAKHSDLLWASRGGGGGNFGIATSFTFRIHPIAEVAVYELTWTDWDDVSRLFQIWQEIAPVADDGFGSVFNAKTKTDGHIYCQGIYRGSEDELREILQPLLEVGDPEVSIATKPYTEAWSELAGDSDTPAKCVIPSGWAYDLVPAEGVATIRKFLAELPGLDGEIWCLNWGGKVGRIPSDATAWVHRKPKFYIEWSGIWETDEEQKVVRTWADRFGKALRTYLTGSYVNVPDSSIADWATAYYGDNYPRLREIKTKYDPLEFFQYEQSIRPY